MISDALRKTLSATPAGKARRDRLREQGALDPVEIISEITQELRAKRGRANGKTAVERRLMGETVIKTEDRTEDGDLVIANRLVRKYQTTLDLLAKRGQLPKHLKMAFDKFAESVAVASGACCYDGDPRGSSSCIIGSLDGGNGSEFGSRTLSNSVIAAARLEKLLWGHIPEDLLKLANQLVHEEVGYSVTKPPSLVSYGHENAFLQEQQARASGATMAIDICRIIHHALKAIGE